MPKVIPCPTPDCNGVGLSPSPSRGLCTPCRFWRKVDKGGPGGCWLWTACGMSEGYGYFHWSRLDVPVGPLRIMAYRYCWELLVGPIPVGFEIDHLCRVPACVNPAHLEPVPPRVNVLRGQTIVAAEAAQTHCLRGHEFTPDNTYQRPDRRGRVCRACHRARNARYKAAA